MPDISGLGGNFALTGTGTSAAQRREPDEEFDVIDVLDLKTVKLGRQGENNTQQVVIDCSEWLTDLPGCQLMVVALRPGEKALYMPQVTVSNGVVTWPILSQDTALAGWGRAEVRGMLNGKIRKSCVFRTKIEPSLDGDGTPTPPTPPDWATEVINSVTVSTELVEQAEELVEEATATAIYAVRYDTNQSLTDAQKATARGNAGAASDDDLIELENTVGIALAGKVDVNAVQGLDDTQKATARGNIDAVSPAEVHTQTAGAFHPRNILLDTDWMDDVDDVAAARVIAWGVKAHQINLLGVVLDSLRQGNTAQSVSSLSRYLDYEGLGSVEIGADKQAARASGSEVNYHQTIISNWAHGSYATLSDVEDCVAFYRRKLAALDGKADIVCLGHLNALSRLLDSSADAVSDLTGAELIAEKVDRLWVMGGKYPSGSGEFNFSHDSMARAAAHNVCANWPVPVVFLGYEAGVDVITGQTLRDTLGEDDLLYKVYAAYGCGESGRPSWDPMTALMAIRGDAVLAGYGSVKGTNSVNATTGANTFTASNDGPHSYVVLHHEPEEYAREMNGILTHGAAEGTSDLILVQDSEPTESANKLWISETSDEVEVPTMAEHDALILVQDSEPASSANRLWISETSDEVEVPSMEEYDALAAKVNAGISPLAFKRPVSDPTKLCASAAEIAMVPEKGEGYVVYLSSDEDYGEQRKFVMLTKFNLLDDTRTHFVVAQDGVSIGGVAISLPFEPNVLRIGNVLYITFLNGETYYCRTFDLTTGTLAQQVVQCSLVINGSQSTFNWTNVLAYVQGQGGSMTTYPIFTCRYSEHGGEYYGTITSANGSAVLCKTTDGVAWTLLGLTPGSAKYEEQIAWVGNTLYAVGRGDTHIYATGDLSTWTVWRDVEVFTTRPQLAAYKDELLQIIPVSYRPAHAMGWEGRNTIEIYMGEEKKLTLSSRYGIVYPAVFMVAGDIYIIFSNNQLFHAYSNWAKDALYLARIGEMWSGEDYTFMI